MMILHMEINIIIDERLEDCPDESWFHSIIEQVLTALEISNAELGLVISTQDKIQELNKLYRGKDRPTDVLSFHMLSSETKKEESDITPFLTPPDGMVHLGEVVISYPQAVLQAEERKHSVEKELIILVIHGILHLLGYDDEEDEKRQVMQDKENEILKSITERT